MMSFYAQFLCFCKSIQISLCVVLALGGFVSSSFAQPTFKFNALVDLELSKAGAQSHYYYNEIDKYHTDLRFGATQINLIGQLAFGPQWSFNARLLLERDKGLELEKFQFLNLIFNGFLKKGKLD